MSVSLKEAKDIMWPIPVVSIKGLEPGTFPKLTKYCMVFEHNTFLLSPFSNLVGIGITHDRITHAFTFSVFAILETITGDLGTTDMMPLPYL